MTTLPDSVARFLAKKRFAVAGVSRQGTQPANAIFRRLTDSGYEVFPVNPKAAEVEAVACYPDLKSIPGILDGVVIATPPSAASDVVVQCAERGVGHVWMHRSFGEGSVSADAVKECEVRGIECIEGGCPMMFCEPVDFGHKCMRWWLQRKGAFPR